MIPKRIVSITISEDSKRRLDMDLRPNCRQRDLSTSMLPFTISVDVLILFVGTLESRSLRVK